MYQKYQKYQDFKNVNIPKFDIQRLNKNLNGIIRKYILKDYEIIINLKYYTEVNSEYFYIYERIISQYGVKDLRTLDSSFIKCIVSFFCSANID